MNTIVTVDSEYFTLNGVKYAKIYQPLKSGTTNLSVRNAYDSDQVLIDATSYTDFTVDAVAPTSQADAIDKLLPVIFLHNAQFYAGNLLQNNADEEDLTESGGYLKFKDRASNVNGRLGHYLIRSGFGWTGTLTSYADSVLEVKEATDLGGGTVTLPANVTLKFSGGRFGNGTIIGNNTRIEAEPYQIFNTDVSLSGTWAVTHAVPQWYGAEGDGSTVDTTALQKTIDNFDKVVLPRGEYVTDILTISGTHLDGGGVATILPYVTDDAILDLDNATIKGIHIDATSTYCLYGIRAGDNSVVKDNTFKGDFGHCIYAKLGTDIVITGNALLASYDAQTVPIVVSECDGVLVQGNTLTDHTGFGIQIRFSRNVSVTGNKVRQQYFTDTFSTTATSQTFTLYPPRKTYRWSLENNGVFISPSITEVSDTEVDFSAVGLTIGQDTTVYAFQGLEQIQVNSGCFNVTIQGNTLMQSGDSNIVLGADYHWTGSAWSLNPGAVVSSDYPKNITVIGNVIEGPTYASGIALNDVNNAIIRGNIIRNVGYFDDIAFQTGINVGNGENNVIEGNTTDNELGYARACVMYTGDRVKDFSGVEASNVFGYNKGVNCKNFEFFPTSSTTVRRVGYNIKDAVVNDLITRRIEAMLDSAFTGGTYSDGYLNVTISGGSGAQSTTTAYGSAKGFSVASGQYSNFYLQGNIEGGYQDTLVRVEFWAKVATGGDAGNFRLYYDHPSDDAEPKEEIVVNTTTWTRYSMVMALGGIDSLFFRLTGTTGTTYFSAIRFDALNVE